MRSWILSSMARLIVAGAVGSLALVSVALPVWAVDIQLVGPTGSADGDVDPPIPPDGSTWMGGDLMHPTPRHQVAFEDVNGDGVLSVGDRICLDGTWYPIVEVKPAYVIQGNWLTSSDVQMHGHGVLVPEANPIGPNHAFRFVQLDENLARLLMWYFAGPWIDWNANGVIDVGDIIEGVTYRGFSMVLWITDVRVAIQVNELVVPTQPTTWGRAKNLFR